VVARSTELTDGGVDYAFETAGRSSLIQAGFNACRPGGSTICIGAPAMDDPLTIPIPGILVMTEKKLMGCLLGSCKALHDIPRFIALWRAGLLDLEGLITARRPLSEVNQALDDLRAGRGIRTVLSI
jgi:Zn-dependent alcohol dehydrogenase